ncbi:MAG: glycosyltransferase family 4 protein [Lachnospiraceae bacterium]|nr:glycosyltransferase family 4 protein [Lachnospiraceae bacterium]
MFKCENRINRIKKNITKLVKKKKYESALGMIMGLSAVLYNYNQWYKDNFLEEQLKLILEKLQNKQEILKQDYKPKKNYIVYYDGMGFDTRGLTLIYLNALCGLGYKVIYVTELSHKGNISNIETIIKKNNGVIEYYKIHSIVKMASEISSIILKYSPQYSFIYTTPYDVHGILAFMNNESNTTRYMINQTDHAFWLGINALDYCIEFRNYGAAISRDCRGVSKDRIFIQPFYPYVNETEEFEGYPFEKKEEDKVIFSGGALYKTIDKSDTYYKLIAYILEQDKKVKFWYAGVGDATRLYKLRNHYPGRVFYTGERQDLYQIFKHVDMYINTYPMVGGLMMQYAAKAGIVPLTIRHDEDGEGFLFDQESIGVEFESLEDAKKHAIQYLNNNIDRKRIGIVIQNAIISKEDFKNNLKYILNKNKSMFEIKPKVVYTERLRIEYKERFEMREFYICFFNKYNLRGLIKYMPIAAIIAIVRSIIK